MARPAKERLTGPVRRDGARGAGGGEPSASSGAPLIQLGTRCASVEDFIDRFAPFATDDTLAIPSSTELPAGTEAQFIIRLEDHAIAMRGRCKVIEVLSVGPAAGRMMMRVRIVEMDDATRQIHGRLVAKRRAAPSGARPARAEAPPLPPVPQRPPAPPVLTSVPAPASASAPTPAPAPVTGDGPTAFHVLETRAPGSAYKLPANPLSGLEAGDLASFIELSLFETEDGGPPLPEASGAPDPPAHEPAQHDLEPPRWPRLAKLTWLPRITLSPAMRKLAMGALPYALCTVIGVVAGHVLRPSRQPAAPPAPTAAAAPATTAAARPAAPSPAPVPAPASEAAPAPATVPAPAPAPVPPSKTAPRARASASASEPAATLPAPPPPPPALAPAATPAAPLVVPRGASAASGASRCTASVLTEPDGAVVLWGKRPIGKTPLTDAAVPCGPASVSLQRERYRPVSRNVTAQPGARATVDERLHRPPATLILTSSPPKARYLVNDQVLGPAPHKLGVMRFESVRVEAFLPGYEPWQKTFYVRQPLLKINAQLVLIAKPAAAKAGATGKRPAR